MNLLDSAVALENPSPTSPTSPTSQTTDVGDLVMGAADGDHSAWEQLVASYTGLVSAITAAHRLNEADAARVGTIVWRRLGSNLGRIRQPDRVGVWLCAVARDECVKALTTSTPTAA
jgi:hypothetical protein